MGYTELREALKKARRVSESDMATIDTQTYVMKRKYCGDCKFFNGKTRVCIKQRIIRICRKNHLKNKE